jgi:exonuclease VII small subunit
MIEQDVKKLEEIAKKIEDGANLDESLKILKDVLC